MSSEPKFNVGDTVRLVGAWVGDFASPKESPHQGDIGTVFLIRQYREISQDDEYCHTDYTVKVGTKHLVFGSEDAFDEVEGEA